MGTSAGSVRGGHRKRIRLLAAALGLVLVVAAAFVVTAFVSAPDDDRVVATVDGAPVTRGELLFHMERVRPVVENRMLSNGGDDPETALRDAALDEIVEFRALLALAREHGLTDIETFTDLRAARQATNDVRAEQVAAGDVVYGLTSFSDEEFYTRTVTGLGTALQDAMTAGQEPALTVTPEEIEAYFNANADEWSAGVTTYRATRLLIPADAGVEDDAVATLVEASGSLEAAAAAIPGASVQPVSIDADGVIDGQPLSPDAVGQLRALAPGGVTDPQTDRGGWAVYRLDEASVDSDEARAQYASRIRAVLVEEAFEALLDERAANQHTDLINAEWNQVKMEDITR